MARPALPVPVPAARLSPRPPGRFPRARPGPGRGVPRRGDPTAYGLARDFGGRWITGPLAELGAFGPGSLCDLADAAQDITADFGGAMSEGAPRTVGGRQVIPVTQVSDRDTTTLCVSATGPATVLACVRTGANPATATFGGFGVPVKAKAPSGAVGRLGPRRHRPSDASSGPTAPTPER